MTQKYPSWVLEHEICGWCNQSASMTDVKPATREDEDGVEIWYQCETDKCGSKKSKFGFFYHGRQYIDSLESKPIEIEPISVE